MRRCFRWLKFLLRWTIFYSLLGVVCAIFSLQINWGGWTYQLEDGRVKWALVICAPGYEPFYNHYTQKPDSEWRWWARYRVSPWFDAGISDAPMDNP